MSLPLAKRHSQLWISLFLVASSFLVAAGPSFATTPGFSVTFFSNVPISSFSSVVQTSNTAAPLQSFSTMAFNYPNFYFEDWNTQQNGSGTAYADAAPFTFTADVLLYAQWIQVSHSAVFFRNETGSDVVNAFETNNSPSALTSVTNLGFIYPNHTFVSWNTTPDGTGTSLPDGALYSFSSAAQLYAQWRANSEILTFSSNGGIGSVDLQATPYGSPTTLPAGTSLSRTGYVLTGWNPSADGTGIQTALGGQFVVLASETLFAQWTPANEKLIFASNGGLGSVGEQNSLYGNSATIPQGSSLTKAFYSFNGWNTSANGSGVQYRSGTQLRVSQSLTFYAQWLRDRYVVSFTIAGQLNKVIPLSVPGGQSTHLRSSSYLAERGRTFVGWFTSNSGGKFAGMPGAVFAPTKSVTLYAHWKNNPFVAVEFSNNGGVGRIVAAKVRSGLSVIVPTGERLHRNGFSFRGWSSRPHAALPTVRIGERLVLTHPRILYAVWRRNLPADAPHVLLGSVGVFAPNSSSLTLAMRNYIAWLASSINQHDRTLVLLYGYATGADSANVSSTLATQRATAVQNQLNLDLTGLNDVGVRVRALGEGRLANSVLVSFRNVEVFAN